MPMYEYGCLDCARQFERLLPMNAVDQHIVIVCPFCQSTHVQRRLSLFAAHSRGETSAPAAAATTSGGGCSCSSCGCGSRS